MKMFGKTEDRAIDNLLRAHLKQQSRASATCAQFDPDLANAYIEHSLPPKERRRYDDHLSACPACRKSMVALFRLAEGDGLVPAAQVKESAGWLAGFKQSFASTAAPRWAMAAVALIVFAVSVPLLLSLRSERSGDLISQVGTESSAAEARGRSSVSTEPASADSLAKSQEQNPQGLIARRESEAKPLAETDQTEQPGRADEAPAPAQPAGGAGPEPPQTQSVEARSLPSADEASRRAAAEAQVPPGTVAAPPAPPKEEQTELAKLDPEKARRLPQSDKEATEMVVLKPGRPDGEPKSEKNANATITAKDAIAPPPDPAASSSSAASRLIAGSTAKQALRDSKAKTAERGRGLPERKIFKKRFWLTNDIWTDKDYNKDKELPEVQIVRDSNVYKELLLKQAGLKPYFAGFTESERAIIVYKGTVYKIVPPGAND